MKLTRGLASHHRDDLVRSRLLYKPCKANTHFQFAQLKLKIDWTMAGWVRLFRSDFSWEKTNTGSSPSGQDWNSN